MAVPSLFQCYMQAIRAGAGLQAEQYAQSAPSRRASIQYLLLAPPCIYSSEEKKQTQSSARSRVIYP